MRGLNGLPIYACLTGDDHGNRSAELIFKQSSWKPNLFVTLYDIWMGAYVTGMPPAPLKPIHPFWVPICVSEDTDIIGSESHVLGYDGGLLDTEVYATQRLPVIDEVYEIKTFEGRILKITGDNPIWTKRGWVPAKNINIRDMVHVYTGNPYDVSDRLGISRWIDRWRRNNLSSLCKEKIQRESNSDLASNIYSESFERNLRLVGHEYPRRHQIIRTKRESEKQRKSLSNGVERSQESLEDSNEYRTIFKDKEATGKSSDIIYSAQTQEESRLQSSARRTRHKISSSNKESELTDWERIKRKRTITREITGVYDISTRSHNFFANGILIHNCMVDHEPVPEATVISAKAAYTCVSPTKWGTEQLKSHGVERSRYIPFGIDTKEWRPSKDSGEKRRDKEWLSERVMPFNLSDHLKIDGDSFLIHINGANKDPYRKAFMRMFTAIQLFLHNNPDAAKDTRVYVHSWMRMARDIPHGAKVLHVDRFCSASTDYHMMQGVPSESMARIARAADVFLHLSEGGGFEIPVMEALSCGVPAIAQDFVANGEIVGGGGWMVPTIKAESGAVGKYFTPLDALQGIADEYQAADALEEAYNNSSRRGELSMKARLKALEYDWSRVNPMWYEFIEEIREETSYKPLEERMI